MGLRVGEASADAGVVGVPRAAVVLLWGRGTGSGPRDLIGNKSGEGVWDVVCWAEHGCVDGDTPSTGGVAELAWCLAVA